MLFTSLAFVWFLAIVVPVFFLVPHRWRAAWLTAASYYFYTYGHPGQWWLLVVCTLSAYAAGRVMQATSDRGRRRGALLAALGLNVGLLLFFKYGDLLAQTANALLARLGLPAALPLPHPVLPIGISFFTFQALSYLFDVYRGRFVAERRLDVFAAYKAFFPQLVAGPIERPANVIPQLHRVQTWSYDRCTSGLRLILWGLFKKLVIADRLALLVAEVYGDAAQARGVQLLVATYAFAWQIFCDFSGYTDMARGTARILGIELMENFQQPYAARSIPEFWSRWHISLSTWFRDYVYVPLGGNRVPFLRWQLNVFAVFVLSGIWHGADWKFALWGVLHALCFTVTTLWSRRHWPRRVWSGASAYLLAGLQILATFHVVCFAWIFFRAASLAEAFQIIRKIAQHPWRGPLLPAGFPAQELLLTCGAVLLLEAVQVLHRTAPGGAGSWLCRRPLWVRWGAYYALGAAILFLAPAGQREFIYFQF